ncbi:sodium:solute symporter family protein [Gracilinema caldarium]|uniref:Na+/solute symporter n=1 Tax=Gracilinema caldarium (strain ATCC 51460 / DSM 7334 / H1) TaxID=744872 RepID=F8F1S2_GRAC1|nr:sodium transporter [Gracilinema caldarium]AEJ19406.1 Na+/solute symporter [Gracilinema caldarium DSM 7334]
MISVILLVLFFTLMTGIGIWGMGRTKTLGDFFLGGRTMGPWISAIAYGTSYFSAVLFIGFAGKQGWLFGLNALWIALGNSLIGAMGAWLVLAKRTRTMTQNLDTMTMPEFLQERYGAQHLKPLAAAIIFFFLLPYSASVFKGLGHLFEAVFHIPYDVALLLMIGFTGIYLVLGGYFAIAMTDLIQGAVMFIGAIAMVLVVYSKEGGLLTTLRHIFENYTAHIPPQSRPSVITILSVVFMTSFGPWALPQMVQKFYAIKDEVMIKRATVVTTIFSAVIGFSAYLVGVSSHVFFNPNTLPKTAKGAINFDSIVPILLTQLLPELLLAIILLLVLSASMSTLSSLVLVSSSSVAIDLYPGRVAAESKKDRSIAMMRFLSALFVIISYFISKYQFDVIVTLMSLSWGAVAGSFGAAFIYGLFWKGATKAGAYGAMLSGLITEIVLFYILGPAQSPLAASLAMLLPFGILPLISTFTKKPDKNVLDRAYKGL